MADGQKKGKGLAKGHACITHRHRHQCGKEGKGDRGWVEKGKGRAGNGDICNSVNNTNKEKIKRHMFPSLMARKVARSKDWANFGNK